MPNSQTVERDPKHDMGTDAIIAALEEFALGLVDRGHAPVDVIAVMNGWAVGQAVRLGDAQGIAANLRCLANRCEAIAMPVKGRC